MMEFFSYKALKVIKHPLIEENGKVLAVGFILLPIVNSQTA